MIDNYLVDARQRFDLDNEMKAKQKLVTNSPYVFTNLEFRSYDFILRIHICYDFFFNWQIEKKTTVFGPMRSLFSLSIAQTETFVEKMGEKNW